jgi:predicted lipid-binding transport protein (Tim44 family)
MSHGLFTPGPFPFAENNDQSSSATDDNTNDDRPQRNADGAITGGLFGGVNNGGIVGGVFTGDFHFGTSSTE